MDKFGNGLYGATIGDICGSIYERYNRKTDRPEEIELVRPDCLFTDDTVLTAAIAAALLKDRNYGAALYEWANKYPTIGYAGMFYEWFHSENPQPYNSWGNGSAMRVSPIGWYFDDEDMVLAEAKLSAEPTHNHPEGIKGAQAVALAILLARQGQEKKLIQSTIQERFEYDLNRTLAEIRPNYKCDLACISCQGSVPEAIIAFLESHDFVSAIQNAISIGGDSDTIACITGSIAEAYYDEIPENLKAFAQSKLPEDIREALGIVS